MFEIIYIHFLPFINTQLHESFTYVKTVLQKLQESFSVSLNLNRSYKFLRCISKKVFTKTGFSKDMDSMM